MTKPSQATQLVEIVENHDVYLFHDHQQRAFAKIDIDGHYEVIEVKRKAFRRWLQRRFYIEFDKAPGSQAVQDAIGVIEGKALFAGQQHDVHVRVAGYNGNVYIDLADPEWRVVRVTPNGHEIQESPDVYFRRPPGMLALPAPAPGGAISDLERFVNLQDDDFVLFKSQIHMALNPYGPYTPTALLGGQGRGKSTNAKIFRRLVDPNVSDLRAEPREVRDLMIAATNGWICAFDNVSRLSDWLSDAICRLATGGGFATRELYADADEIIFEAKRPVILNGIEDFIVRNDLLDRSVLLYPPEIDGKNRRSEEGFWQEFDEAHPGIFGSLLEAVSAALRNKHQVRIPELPRMADYAIWATAAETALDIETGNFMKAYKQNRAGAVAVILEASRIANYISKLMKNRAEWRGTATDLLDALNGLADESTQRAKDWPRSPQKMSNDLRRLAPTLRAEKIETEHLRTGQRREIILRKLEEPGSESSLPSQVSQPSDDDDDHDDPARTHSYSSNGHPESLDAPLLLRVQDRIDSTEAAS